MIRNILIFIFLVFIVGCGQSPNQAAPQPIETATAAQAQPDPQTKLESAAPINLKQEEVTNKTWYRNQVMVLNYHHIDRNFESPYTITPENFLEQMEFLKKNNFHPLKLEEFYEFMGTGLLTQENAVLITFDDGYESFYKEAFPILKRFKFPAANFVVYEKLRDSIDRKREKMIPPLTFVQMKEMTESGLISFQSHSYGIHEETERDQTEGEQDYRSKLFVDFSMSRAALESLVGYPILGIAYPHGVKNDALLQVVKKVGYKYGFAVNYALVNKDTNPLLIPRVDVGKADLGITDLRRIIMDVTHTK